jgi:hypothetical protein
MWVEVPVSNEPCGKEYGIGTLLGKANGRQVITSRAGGTVRIVKVETIRNTALPNVLWVQVHSEDGLIGLGETFYLPSALSHSQNMPSQRSSSLLKRCDAGRLR